MAFRLFSKVFPKDSIYLNGSLWILRHKSDTKTAMYNTPTYFKSVKVKIYDWYEGVGFIFCRYKVEENE